MSGISEYVVCLRCSEVRQLNPIATCKFLAISYSCGRISYWLQSYLEITGSEDENRPASAVIQLLCPGRALGLVSVLPGSQAICFHALFAFPLSSLPLIWITFD